MGNICKIQTNQDCVSVKSSKQNNKVNKNTQKTEDEMVLVHTVRKQNPLEQFTYDLQNHLDSFSEEFYSKDYLYENPSCPFQEHKSDLDFTFLEQAKICKCVSAATIRNKRQVPLKNNNLTQRSIVYRLQEKKKKKQQSQNSLEIPKKISQIGILRNSSRSFDSIYSRKKSVRFSNKLQICAI